MDQQLADGFLFFSEPPTPLSFASLGGRARGTVGRGSRGARGGGRGGPGRGRKSEATRAAEKAKLAAFLVAKYGNDSKLGAAASGAAASTNADGVETRVRRR